MARVRRRAEGIPLLVKKFQANAEPNFPLQRLKNILALLEDVQRLEQMLGSECVEDLETNG